MLLILPVGIVSAPKIVFADEVSVLDEGNQDITFKLVTPSDNQQNGKGQASSSSSGNGNFLSNYLPQLNEKNSMIVILLILGVVAVFLSIYYIRRQRGEEKNETK